MGNTDAPQYIPEYAGSSQHTNILTPAEADISGEGTSDTTLKRDFAGVAGYLCTITGGCKENSIVTADGTYNFGSKYFFNSNNKCTVESEDNIHCNPNTKKGDSVYEYIYLR